MKLDDLYPLQKKDASRAGEVLVSAFERDPVWQMLFQDATPAQRIAAFEAPIRYCLKYGQVYAPSAALEGVAAWTPGKLAEMTLWRMLLSGAMGAGLRMGMTMSRKMMQVFAPIEADRKAIMRGKDFIYLLVIGVAPQLQGQGHAGKLLRALFAESKRAQVSIYLETQTDTNCLMKQHDLFCLYGSRSISDISLDKWYNHYSRPMTRTSPTRTPSPLPKTKTGLRSTSATLG
jgi:ribosomal protein S18 acetylase RimI-like enzyme